MFRKLRATDSSDEVQGRSQDFSKGGGGGVSHPLYFPDCHVNIPPLL